EVLRPSVEPGSVLLRAAAVPAGPGRPAARPAAAAERDPRVRGRRMGERRLVLADGRGAGRQGNPQPGGQLGPAVGAQLADLAPDAAPVPPRAHLGPSSSSAMISSHRSRHSVQTAATAGGLPASSAGNTASPGT